MNPRDVTPGMPAALAALVIALDESGALSKDKYRDVLLRLWADLPEEESFDGEAIVCQRLLDYLG